MTQLMLPYQWRSVRAVVPRSVVTATPARTAQPVPKLPAMLCGHKRLGPPEEVRRVHDPIYGTVVIEEAACERCGAAIRRTRYPELSSRPSTLPESDRTIVGGSRALRPARVC